VIAHVTKPSTGTMYARQRTASPMSSDRNDWNRLSGDDSPAMRRPMALATPAFPTSAATTSAHSANGTTAMPTTEAARRTSTGTVRRSTSRPRRNALSGRSINVSAHARTCCVKTAFSTR
jgi:hypothetical protein